MDFDNLTFYKAETNASGLVKITYHIGGDPTNPHIWVVPPAVDLESYDFEIPELELTLINAARLNYTPIEE